MLTLIPFLGLPLGLLFNIGAVVALLAWLTNPTATVSFMGIGPFDFLAIAAGMVILAF